jgi:hypothetical protein
MENENQIKKPSKFNFHILFFVVMGLLVLGGIALVISVGLKPKALPIIKLSHFENEVVIANSLEIGLKGEINKWNLLMFGVEPNEEFHRKIVQQLINTSSFAKIYIDEELGSNWIVEARSETQLEKISFQNNSERIYQELIEANSKNQKVLLISLHIQTSQLLDLGWSKQMNRALAESVGAEEVRPQIKTIAMTWFPRTRDLEKDLKIQCVTAEEMDKNKVGRLGCQILQMARFAYKKNNPSFEWTGLLSLVGSNDYLFLLAKRPNP